MNMKVRVKVHPHAHHERFEEVREGVFEAAVKEPRERNEANTRVQRLVARHYNVPLTSVRFLTGARGTNKVFEVVR